ncbi:MAG: ATPase involved in phage/plasmid replication [Nitrosopumilales archaeon]|nr:MAG: ATPase involved in phage/plasmid replication [Nitrosopumilales archaeon]
MSLEELRGKTFSESDSKEDKPENQNNKQKLYEFAKEQIERIVISDTDSTLVYGIIQVNNHKQTIRLGSFESIQWLKALYYDKDEDFHSEETYINVLSMIVAQAHQDEKTERVPIYNRIALIDNAIYYDFCNSNWEAIKISKAGYQVVPLNEKTPIFTRKQQQNPQVMPKKGAGAALDTLLKLFRIQEADRLIFKIHLITMLLEKYPIPIMIVHGEHGSIKSTITKSVAKILDPSAMNVISIPKTASDLALLFNNQYVTNFDNVSEISQEVSDMMCRAITGEGFRKRKLYTDDTEIIWNYKRKIIINGITPSLDYPDFKDRSILYETIPVREDERISEEEFQARFNKLLPFVLDEIFTILSQALLMYRRIKKEINTKQRMADFTVFGECISRMLKNPDFSFIKVYREKLDIDSLKMVDSYPIIEYITEIMETENKMETSVQDLFSEVCDMALKKQLDTRSSEIKFPQAPNLLSTQINQLKSTFRRHNLEIEIKPYNLRDGKYTRGRSIVYITKLDSGQKTLRE